MAKGLKGEEGKGRDVRQRGGREEGRGEVRGGGLSEELINIQT